MSSLPSGKMDVKFANCRTNVHLPFKQNWFLKAFLMRCCTLKFVSKSFFSLEGMLQDFATDGSDRKDVFFYQVSDFVVESDLILKLFRREISSQPVRLPYEMYHPQ